MYNKSPKSKKIACAFQPDLLKQDPSRSISFYNYGGGRGKVHVQTVEGDIPCGADSVFYDGASDRYSYDGNICIWHYEERSHNYYPTVVPIESVISCKKCQKALKKLVANLPV